MEKIERLKKKYHDFKYFYNHKTWKFINAKFFRNNYLHEDCERQFKDIKININNSDIVTSFKKYGLFKQTEYIANIKIRSIIEPEFGWVITQFNHVLVDSLPYCTITGNTAYDQNNTLKDFKIRNEVMPSFNRNLMKRINKSSKIFLKRVISLRDISESSYFHIYNDVLSKLILLSKFNITDDIPLVIANKLYSMNFFKNILALSNLKNRNWVIQDKDIVEAEEVIYCKTLSLKREYFDGILKLFNIKIPRNDLKKKIFLNRRREIGRNIENIEDIKNICDKFNFEIIETENMSLEEQIELFSHTRYLIGLHGASFTNMIFRQGKALNLLEIFPPDNIPPHFFWLSYIFGYGYDAIQGIYKNTNENILDKKSYYLNPDIFLKKMKELKERDFFN